MLRGIFIGTELRILEELIRLPFKVVGVYLPQGHYWLLDYHRFLPKKLMWRYLKTVMVHGRLAQFMKQHQIPKIMGTEINHPECINEIRKLNPDIGIVANFGQIIRKPVIEIPRHGFINFHPSLLPRYRGPHPFERIMLNGERKSGITWHRMTQKVDSGDILVQKEFLIEPSETIKDIEAKSMRLAILTIGPLLEDIEHGTATPKKQDESEATCFPELTETEKQQLKVRLNQK